MRTKTAVSGSLSNKRALTDAEINAGFAFNTILESPDFNGQLFDIDEQVDIISKEICNFLTGHSVTPVGNDNTQLKTLLDSLFGSKQDKLTAGQNITIDANNVISTTGASALNFPLFASMWMYCKPFNASWVNANNYSWLYASMYVSAYNFLVSQLHPTGKAEEGSTYYVLRFDNGEGETTNVLVGSGTLSDLQSYCTSQGYTYNAAGTIEEFECYKTLTTSSETIEGITITYYETYNGMKIITDAAEITNEETLYNLTGVDNYFILDETNNRFKLPRTEWGFVGTRSKVGEYVSESLPQHTHTRGSMNITGKTSAYMRAESVGTEPANSALYTTASANVGEGANNRSGCFVNFDASRSWTGATSGASNSSYQDNAPVQQRATQMYLYFYLGNTGEIVDHQIASIALELFNNKADLDLNNVTVPHLVSRTVNASGITIEIYSDGYVCMRGYSYKNETINSNSGKAIVVNLPITMRDTNYDLYADKTGSAGTQYAQVDLSPERTSTTQITLKFYNNSTATSAATVMRSCWEVKGYKAS